MRFITFFVLVLFRLQESALQFPNTCNPTAVYTVGKAMNFLNHLISAYHDCTHSNVSLDAFETR